MAKQHLRTGVPDSAAEGVKEGTLFKLPGKSKVAELDATALVQEHILELEVSMDGASIMDITDGQAQLPEDNADLVFVDPALLDQVVEELPTGAELGDEPNVALCRDDLVELSYMWVVELPMVVYFAGELGGNGLWDLLDRDAGVRETVSAESNLSKCPLSDYLGVLPEKRASERKPERGRRTRPIL